MGDSSASVNMSSENSHLALTSAGLTDVGIIRSGNEDNYLIVPDYHLFVVADGMGGHAAGEVASEMAVRIIAREVGDCGKASDTEAADRMRHAIHSANGAIFQRTLKEHDKRGMGTTATAMVAIRDRYLIGQVGDSRAYVLREDSFLQLTKDHSYVQDLYMGVLQDGDLFLLASDGLTGMIEDHDIHRIMGSGKQPQDLVGELIAEANRRGGLDNITAIIVRVDHVP